MKQPRHLRRAATDVPDELVESIKRHGILQPPIVTPSGEVVIGEARRQAAAKAGVKIEPIVRDLDEVEALTIRLSDEMAKSNVSFMARAHGLAELRELLRARSGNGKVTHAVLARHVGTTEGAVEKLMAMLNLPDEVQQMAANGAIGRKEAEALASAQLNDNEKGALADRFAAGDVPGGKKAQETVQAVQKAPQAVRKQVLEGDGKHKLDPKVAQMLANSGLPEKVQSVLATKVLGGRIPERHLYDAIQFVADNPEHEATKRLIAGKAFSWDETLKYLAWEEREAELERERQRDARAWSSMAFFRKFAIGVREHTTSIRVVTSIVDQVPDTAYDRVRDAVTDLRDECERFLGALESPLDDDAVEGVAHDKLLELQEVWGAWEE